MNDTQELEIALALNKAIKEFNQTRSNEALALVVDKLLESRVLVPCTIRLEDGVNINNLRPGDDANIEGVHYVSEVLKTMDGKKWIPYFTTLKEMPEKYQKGYSQMNYKFIDICDEDLLNNQEITGGIVINAFTDPFFVTKELMSIIINYVNAQIRGE